MKPEDVGAKAVKRPTVDVATLVEQGPRELDLQLCGGASGLDISGVVVEALPKCRSEACRIVTMVSLDPSSAAASGPLMRSGSPPRRFGPAWAPSDAPGP